MQLCVHNYTKTPGLSSHFDNVQSFLCLPKTLINNTNSISKKKLLSHTPTHVNRFTGVHNININI